MARKPANQEISVDISIPNEIADMLSENANSMTKHSREIMEGFGDGLPYEKMRIIHETKFYMAQSAEAMLEAGKRLVILKEHEPHGDFEKILRNQIGIPERTAQRMMQSAIKYLSPNLKEKAPALALLGKTKLFELMLEDDDALTELANGGTIAGMNLDDIDRMSSRELRSALRKSRDDIEGIRLVVSDKDKKIEEQSRQLFMNEKKSPNENLVEKKLDLTRVVSEIDHDFRVNLYNKINDLILHGEKGNISQVDFILSQIEQLEKSISNIKQEVGNNTNWN